jgi:ATP-dependent Lhr-like helicase
VLDALWDLVWAGEVTNDTPGALRAFVRPPRSPRRSAPAARRAFRSRREVPPSAVGRWTLVRARGPQPPTPTERTKALAEQLLARHGVLTRAAVMAEAPAGGFAGVYPVLKALEEAGRIRRGYFVAGLGGSQFAQPGAVDRLRSVRDPGSEDVPPAVILAATDPANPYGAALPWPEAAGRAQRAAGVHVALVDGQLAAYIQRGEKDLAPVLPDEDPTRTRVARALARACARWARLTGRMSIGWGSQDAPLNQGPLAPHLREAGFLPIGPGFRLQALPGPPATDEGAPDDPLDVFEGGEADVEG